jgi:glutamine synthetase
MTAANVLKFMKEKEVEFVDLRFTDPRGNLQHLTLDHTLVVDPMLHEGVIFAQLDARHGIDLYLVNVQIY